MRSSTGVDPARVASLLDRENERFAAERARRSMPRGVPMSWMDDLYEHPPVFVERGHGARFTDVDGHEYLDAYIADMSAFRGHAPPARTTASSRRDRPDRHW